MKILRLKKENIFSEHFGFDETNLFPLFVQSNDLDDELEIQASVEYFSTCNLLHGGFVPKLKKYLVKNEEANEPFFNELESPRKNGFLSVVRPLDLDSLRYLELCAESIDTSFLVDISDDVLPDLLAKIESYYHRDNRFDFYAMEAIDIISFVENARMFVTEDHTGGWILLCQDSIADEIYRRLERKCKLSSNNDSIPLTIEDCSIFSLSQYVFKGFSTSNC